MGNKLAGLGKLDRSRLASLLKSAGAAVTVRQASELLSVPPEKARFLLGSWCRKGWLSRVKPGVYVYVPLQASTPDVMVDEPWLLAQILFKPCYIGGWSAAAHWDFTEQIFDTTFVVTTKKVRTREQKLKGVRFQVKTTQSARMFGTKKIWIESNPVEISDPTKTVIDLLNDPSLAGGGRMMADMFFSYMRSDHKSRELLLKYAEQMDSGAVYKRMGFLLEKLFPAEMELIQKCQSKMRAGYSQLDPSNPGKVLITHWGLWVPKGWKDGVPK
jgi:predicted transcriptional regulator of viral defense system